MCLLNNLQFMPVAEIRKIKEGIMLSEDEEIVFDMSVRGKSVHEISMEIFKSDRTVFYIKANISKKINNYLQYMNYLDIYEKTGLDLARS